MFASHRSRGCREWVARSLLHVTVPLLLACSDAPVVSTFRVVRGSVEATVTGVNSGTVKAEQIAELAFGAVGRVKLVSASVGDIVGKAPFSQRSRMKTCNHDSMSLLRS